MVGKELGEAFKRHAQQLGDVVLEVENLSDSFLDNISFTVRAGEVLGLAGAVGAGRTEIMTALFGLTPGSAGRIRVEGKPIAPRHPSRAMREGLALVPEERKSQGVVLGMTVEENIAISSLRDVSAWGFTKPAATKQLTLDGIKALNIKTSGIDQRISSLSGGNQQKTVLAKWLATKPRVLLLDDPTRGIDVGAKQEIYAIIDRLAKEGYAIILSSSELGEVIRLSDRVLVLYEGRIKAELQAEGLTEEQVLQLSHA